MEPLRPVRWREGMFVRPHHFQQFDLYLEARQIAYHQALVGNGWGVVRMELAEDLLANYTFEVKSLRAVLPDGTLVVVSTATIRTATSASPPRAASLYLRA